MANRNVKGHVQSLIAAVQFLTRIPVPLTVPFEERTLARSVIYFPAAGALIGIVSACGLGLFAWLLPPLAAAVVALALWIALSGGLHVDGWMDTADGVLSHRSRERMLEIMKDSRVGAMGVIAGVLLLLFKFALLAELAEAVPSRPSMLVWLVVCPIWSRWWMGAAIALYPNARQGQGMGAMFHGVRWRHPAAAFAAAFLLTAAALNAVGYSLPEAAGAAALFAAISALTGLAGASWLARKLGGLTGDTYGALNEGVEAALLAAVIVVWRLMEQA